MENSERYFDFHEAKLDEQLEQLEQNAHLAKDQPAARAYIGLRALYAPVSKHEEQALARVHKRLAVQTRSGRETFREPVFQLLTPVTEQETLPMLLPPKRRQKRQKRNRWLSTLAAVLIVGLLIGGFLALIGIRSQGTHPSALPPVLHRTGSWHIVPTPNVPKSISAVTVLSKDDAWAVGDVFQPSVTPFILHWDGKTWKQVQAASAAPRGSLAAVAALAPDDVWAVGSTSGPSHALIEHWDGKRWSVIASPDLSLSLGFLNGIAALAPNDIWAVGSSLSLQGGNGTSHALIEHWNGSRWEIIPIPAAGVTQNLSGIIALSPTDIWAVGHFALTPVPNLADYRALIEHWDGKAWKTIANPRPRASSLFSISASSPTDVWAVGEFRSDDAYPFRSLVEHWDGKQWTIVDSPNPALNAGDSLIAVAALAPNNIWAVTGSLLHWDGRQWKIVPTASLPQGSGTPGFTSIAPDPSSPGVLWLAGSYSMKSYPLIETNMP